MPKGKKLEPLVLSLLKRGPFTITELHEYLTHTQAKPPTHEAIRHCFARLSSKGLVVRQAIRKRYSALTYEYRLQEGAHALV